MNGEAKFTKGPWAFFRGFIATANPDGSIPLDSRIVVDAKGVSEADTALIAAAPDMYEALSHLLALGDLDANSKRLVSDAFNKARGQS